MFLFYSLFVGMGFITIRADKNPDLDNLIAVILLVAFLPLSFITLFAQIQRWHDRNKSGWWILINFVPVFGFIWATIELYLIKGTSGENRFGPDSCV